MSKHTPGPWEVSCSVQVVGASPGNRCIVSQPFTNGWEGPVIRLDIQEANAHLISAAPDLLKALIDFLEDPMGDPEPCRKAIAKALGESL